MKPVKLFNCARFLLTFSICLLPCCSGQAHSEVCEGECKPISQCRRIAQNFELYASQNKIKYCNLEDSIVCCTKRRRPPTINIRADSRIFVQKCAEFNETIHKNYPCRTTPLIIAGTKADAKEFPFMALLGIKRANENPNWICGGTLISTNFVITASHCLTNLVANDLIVRLGELDHSRNDDDANPEDFNVVSIISNPNYDLDRFDAAILELDREVTFNEYIKPACLPWTSGDEYNELVATGWGDQGGAKFSSHLLKVTLSRFDDIDCSYAEENYDEHTQICVGSRTDRRDTCNGDSGGPLFVKHPNFPCLHVLVGITSKGRECGLKGTPALYTRVHLFVRWIEQVIWDARADLGYQRPG